VKHEVEAARGTDEDIDGYTGAMQGAGWSTRVARGTGWGATRGVGVNVEAARGTG
jgi:hypothetical protein